MQDCIYRQNEYMDKNKVVNDYENIKNLLTELKSQETIKEEKQKLNLQEK